MESGLFLWQQGTKGLLTLKQTNFTVALLHWL
jgi:hypothetical protein